MPERRNEYGARRCFNLVTTLPRRNRATSPPPASTRPVSTSQLYAPAQERWNELIPAFYIKTPPGQPSLGKEALAP
jgi:hypothetical protein